MPYIQPHSAQPAAANHTAPQPDTLSRQAVELTRLDARIAELLLCLHAIPPLPDSAPATPRFTDGDGCAGTHPL
jgi:hypothetical protein